MDAKSLRVKLLQANTVILVHAKIISSRMFVLTTVIRLNVITEIYAGLFVILSTQYMRVLME